MLRTFATPSVYTKGYMKQLFAFNPHCDTDGVPPASSRMFASTRVIPAVTGTWDDSSVLLPGLLGIGQALQFRRRFFVTVMKISVVGHVDSKGNLLHLCFARSAVLYRCGGE